MRRRPAGRSLAQQAFVLRARFPEADISLGHSSVRWTGYLAPSELGRTYLVRMTYRLRQLPEVRVLRPTLEARLAESLPHVYHGGSLCLHESNDWDGSMLLADTIIPWAAEWLFFYEIWKATGAWHGGGAWPPIEQSDSAPSQLDEEEERNMAYDGFGKPNA